MHWMITFHHKKSGLKFAVRHQDVRRYGASDRGGCKMIVDGNGYSNEQSFDVEESFDQVSEIMNVEKALTRGYPNYR
jgi:hypothetical protein